MAPKAADKAIVVPPKGGQWNFKQSRFEHLAPTPFRCVASGRSGSGKTSALHSAVTNFYRGCFDSICIVARTAKLDHSFIELKDYAERHMKQDDKEEQFVFQDFGDEADLMKIFNDHALKVAKQKLERKQDHSKAPLSQKLWIFDDVSDSQNLRTRSESVLNKLFTQGRHSGQSVWLNVHALSALGTLLRKNASQLVIFKISNAKEYDFLREEYSHLVGKEEFDEIYKLAVNAKPYSFLTILPHSQNENTMFLARFDERISVDSDSEV